MNIYQAVTTHTHKRVGKMTKVFDCNHEKVENLVRNEVVYCASQIVTELLAKEDNIDDFYHLRGREDYLEAIHQELANKDLETVLSDYNVEDLTDIEENDLVDIANEYNIDPYYNEVYEYWIVSGFLADRLEAEREVIERDFFGLTIWGRMTTGQAICCDHVICKIATDIFNEVEEMTKQA